jgi:hypothetical protein
MEKRDAGRSLGRGRQPHRQQHRGRPLPGFPELIGPIGPIGRIGRIHSRPWEAERAEIGAGGGGGFCLRGQRSPAFAPRTCVTAFDLCGLCGLVGFCGLAKKKERGAQVFRQSDSGICRSLKIADPGRFSLLGCLGHTGDFGVLRLGGFLATALVYPAPTPRPPLTTGERTAIPSGLREGVPEQVGRGRRWRSLTQQKIKIFNSYR